MQRGHNISSSKRISLSLILFIYFSPLGSARLITIASNILSTNGPIVGPLCEVFGKARS